MSCRPKILSVLIILFLGYCNIANAAITVSDNNLHTDRGTVYNHLSYLTATGGTAPYTFTAATFSTLYPGYVLNSDGTISGQFCGGNGKTTFSSTARDSLGATGTSSTSLIINASPTACGVTVSGSPPAGIVGTAYSTTFTASGGTSPYSFSVTTGALPPGLSLNSSGTLSGTPTLNGSYTFTILAIDSTSPTTKNGSGTFTISITGLSMTSTPSTASQVGVSYSQTNVASGGTGPYTYSVSSGSLPAGTSLNTSTGTVSGTPTTAGSFSYTIRATDSVSATVTGASNGTITSATPLSLAGTPSSSTQVGVTYTQPNVASGGVGTYTYTRLSGSLPAGTSLNASTGVVSGTPTTAGSFSYVIQVADSTGSSDMKSNSTATQLITGTISAPSAALSLTSTPSASTQVGVAYSQTNVASGGSGTYTYSLLSGSLPAGTSLNTSTGTVSGTPTTSGAFSYTIRVTDSVANTANSTISGTIAPPAPSITSTPSSSTQVGVAYSQTNVASGGTAPYTYSLLSGSLPAGTTLNTSTGTVSGTPTAYGSFSYTIRVTDNLGATADGVSSGTIAPAALTITPTPSSSTQVGVAYSQTNVGSGGVTPYIYSVASGSLPAGTILDTSTGTVSGTPTAYGAFNYTIRVTDNLGATADGVSSGTITPATLTITPTPSSSTQVDVAYSQTNVGSGGVTPYTYSLFSGSLPAGTTLDTSTGTVSGTPTTSGSFSYTIRVTDNLGVTADGVSNGTITPSTALAMTSTPSASTQVGVAYLQTNVGSGGSGTYTYSLLSGSLPDGVSLDTSTGTVSGTPTTSGSFSYTIRVTDSASTTADGASSGIIAPAILAITSTPSSATQVGVAYSQTNVGSGGLGTYTYSLLSGSLPDGVSLDTSTGTVSGVPTTAGSFSYTIRVTDSINATADGESNGAIAPPALALVQTAASSTQVGVAYLQTNVASGGVEPYTYSLESGSLPAGVSLDTSTGTVSGTPTASGSFSYTIQVTDNLGTIVDGAINGTIAPAPLTITPTPSSSTQVGVAYLQTNVANGGVGPYTYSLASGSLPDGTNLDTSTGTVSGTPTTSEPFSYMIRVTDSLDATQDAASNGTIAPATLAIASTPSVSTQVGVSYSQTNVASGGIGPYTYSVSSGSLPDGLSLDTSTGTVSGVPTTSESFSYTIQVTDSTSTTADGVSNGTISPSTALSITSTPSAFTQVGVPYLQTNVASGGVGTYTYSLLSGSLPDGTTLDTSTGTVSGIPTTAGAFSYTIQVTDSASDTADGASSAALAPATLAITSTPSASTQVGVPYSQTNVASGGTEPYTYSVASGSLPDGTTLDTSTGTVSGTPTTSGSFNYTIQVTDSSDATADGISSGTIAPATSTLTINSTPSASTQVGVAYSQTNTASGGTGPYTYSLISGNLPTGTSLDPATGTVSGTPTASGSFSYTISVTDNLGATANSFSSGIIVAATLIITSTPSVSTQVGVPYSQTNVASGGTGPYTYSLIAGSLPTGTILNPSTGTVSGTPTTAGSFNYTIRVTDNANTTADGVSSGTIASATLILTSTPSASTQVGTSYSQTNTASGGTGPYTYSLVSGSLPAGTNFNPSTGTVSGTPTTFETFSYTIRVTDNLGAAADSINSGTIIPAAITLISTPSASKQVGAAYSQTNVASGGSRPYVYRIVSGILPTGTRLHAGTGLVSGVPNETGTFTYVISATDNNGTTTQNSISATITTARPDPTLDPSVKGMISAQVLAAEQLTKVQIDNVWNHLQDLHSHFGFPRNNQKNCQPITLLSDLATGQVSLTKMNQCNRFLPDLWVAGVINDASIQVQGSDTTNQLTTSGVTLGVDFQISDNLIAGVAVGYGANTTTNIDAYGSVNDAENLSGTLYASYQPFKNWFLDALVGYGGITNNNSRWSTTDLVFLNGNRNANAIYGSLALTNRTSIKNFKIDSYIREDIISVTFDSYSESGSSMALSYDEMTATTQILATGLIFSYDLSLKSGSKLIPFGKLEYMNASGGNTAQGIYYADLGPNSLNYNLDIGVIPTNMGLAGVGFNYETKWGINWGISWFNSFGSSSYHANEFNAAVTVRL